MRMKKFNVEKIICDKFTAFLIIAIFVLLHIYNMVVNSAYFVKSAPRVLGVSFQYFAGRAYPGSEFVVASNLSKWKKLEPNEINFSQGFFCLFDLIL